MLSGAPSSRFPGVVLLSGGLDSAVTLAHAIDAGYECHCLSLDYGQRHLIELQAARRVADSLGAAGHLVLHLDLRAIGGSALTADIDVPKDRSPDQLTHGIPPTYVPARNLVFLSLAVAYAEVIGAWDVFIGVNAIDYSGYPDCRPEFIRSFEKTARLATKAGLEGGDGGRGEGGGTPRTLTVHTPLVSMSKAQIIRRGVELGVDFALTHSCYDPSPDGLACGRCDSCVLRTRGFREAGVPDPTGYAPADAASVPGAPQTGWAAWGE